MSSCRILVLEAFSDRGPMYIIRLTFQDYVMLILIFFEVIELVFETYCSNFFCPTMSVLSLLDNKNVMLILTF